MATQGGVRLEFVDICAVRTEFGLPQTRTFSYDSLKRLTQASNPGSLTVNYPYDENSSLKTKNDARSITTTYSYDALNRVISRIYTGDPQNTQAVSYKYDGQTLLDSYPASFARGSSIGRLVAVTSGGTSAGNYTGYDQLGRVTSSYQQSDSQNYGFAYGYNIAGEMTSETYPSSRVVQTEYDTTGPVASLSSGGLPLEHEFAAVCSGSEAFWVSRLYF